MDECSPPSWSKCAQARKVRSVAVVRILIYPQFGDCPKPPAGPVVNYSSNLTGTSTFKQVFLCENCLGHEIDEQPNSRSVAQVFVG